MRLLTLFQILAFASFAAEPDSASTLARYFERRVAEIETRPQPVPSNGEEWERMRAAGLGHIPLVVGGIIPEDDAARLRAMGVAAVYTPKDFELNLIMLDIVGIVDAQDRAA